MKKFLLACCCAAIFTACNNESKEAAKTDTNAAMPADLPYTATYKTNWTDKVSDADLKMVLDSYKDWETGNLEALSKLMADTTEVDMSDGAHGKMTNADLMKKWSVYRDSLSSVKIKMDTWRKMYSPDDSSSFVVVWYDEYDTYKDGRVDSASMHDINGIKDGKINWYSQFKRPKK